MSVQYHVAHVDGWYRVYFTTNGIDRHYVGPRFDTPRGAIDYAGTLRGMPVVSPLRTTSDDGGALDSRRHLGSPDALVPPATRAG